MTDTVKIYMEIENGQLSVRSVPQGAQVEILDHDRKSEYWTPKYIYTAGAVQKDLPQSNENAYFSQEAVSDANHTFVEKDGIHGPDDIADTFQLSKDDAKRILEENIKDKDSLNKAVHRMIENYSDNTESGRN